ncbi:MAG: LuxR C-terminal-related transcriptional regulator [Vicinamibacterales bacterium]
MPATVPPGPSLTARDLARLERLWQQLADFPAGEYDAALAHLLTKLCALAGAEQAGWIGAVQPCRRGGWQARAALAVEADVGGGLASLTVEDVRGWASIVTGESPGSSRPLRNQATGRPGTMGHTLLVKYPVERAAGSWIALRRTRGGPFRATDRARVTHAVRGVPWLHRQLLLGHGLIRSGEPLSPTDRRVQAWLLTAGSEREIAATLHVTPSTLHTYVTDLYRKLGVRGRAGLMARWLGQP